VSKRDLYCLFGHGIGQPERGYSDFAQRTLSKACQDRGINLYAREVLYGPLFDMESAKYLQAVEKRGSSGGATQKLAINTLADALQYQSNAKLREKIANVFDYEFLSLRAPGEVVIICHSLGVLATLHWLRTRTGIKKAKIVAMGCNVGLFTMGQEMDVPPQVRLPGTFFNIFDEDDFLGYALAVRPELAHVLDVQVDVDGWLAWTGLAHTCYWETKSIYRDVIPNLLAL
jgi:Serine hydrolase